MATQTRFDLNAAIENWRNELTAQPQLTPDDRRELEKHLADTMAELRQRGLNDEESFWLARKRIGQPQQLAEEFEKADPAKIWRERVFWIAAALVAVQIWGRISAGLFSIVSLYLSNGGFSIINSLPEMLFYLIPVTGLLALVATGRITRIITSLSFVFRSKIRLAFTAIFLIIGSEFFENLVAFWRLWIKSPISGPPPASFLLQNSVLNIIHSLFFVVLLVWLLPPDRKSPKLA